MADIVNLRQARKRKVRREKELVAEENRRTSSIPSRVKQAQKQSNKTELRRLDGHLLSNKQKPTETP